jgi:iron(III) transport system permease protein
MISCLWLERPGVWRGLGVAALLTLAVLPVLPLAAQAISSPGAIGLGRGFGGALRNSAVVALLAVAVSWVLGLPAGVLAALYEFPARKFLLALTVLPLLVPAFLWAIGWSRLTARLGPAVTETLSGSVGCGLVFATGVFPLVLLAALTSTAALSGSQVEAARLAGGERTVFLHAGRHAAAPAGLAAGLGGVLTLSDPGPGLILGLRTAAAEILTSFSALYDFRLAGLQCLALSGVVLLLAVPLALLAAPRLANEMLARQSRGLGRVRHRTGSGAALGLLLLAVLATVLPLAGLALPLLAGHTEFARAGRVVARTGVDTLHYAAGTGAVSVALGLALAFCVGRGRRLRVVSLGVCLVLFALPPALSALGVVQTAAEAPPWTDWLLRSRLTVCLVLGLRFVPVATVFGLGAWGSMPSSWALVGAVHGVSLTRYLRRVVLPALLPAAGAAALLVALLATADVGTVLLVHPPGHDSLPLALFTIMANAPEALVSSLCLLYVVGAGGLLALGWRLLGRGNA